MKTIRWRLQFLASELDPKCNVIAFRRNGLPEPRLLAMASEKRTTVPVLIIEGSAESIP